MNAIVRNHLPVIAVVTVLGFVTGCIFMSLTHDAAANMSASMFSTTIFIIPCIVMLVGSFAIAFTANTIGRQLYVVVLAICLVCGVISMFVGSSWLSDPALSAQLLANSPDGSTVTPILQSPMTILRDVAAFIVVPTVGLIIGAWAGSRVHPMQAEKDVKKKQKKGKK